MTASGELLFPPVPVAPLRIALLQDEPVRKSLLQGFRHLRSYRPVPPLERRNPAYGADGRAQGLSAVGTLIDLYA
jgi:hypothetical protein